jgi:hypothetical protein
MDNRFPMTGVLNSAAGAVGTDGSDNAARVASSAAFVKRGILGLLHAVTLNQRPGFS